MYAPYLGGRATSALLTALETDVETQVRSVARFCAIREASGGRVRVAL
jgi:hypothetical protein